MWMPQQSNSKLFICITPLPKKGQLKSVGFTYNSSLVCSDAGVNKSSVLPLLPSITHSVIALDYTIKVSVSTFSDICPTMKSPNNLFLRIYHPC